MNYYDPYTVSIQGYTQYGNQRSYKPFDEALALVKQSVLGEREDELFYDYLISQAPTNEEKDIIKTIRNDERRHNKMFREIYKFYTGEEVTSPKEVDFKKPVTYREGIKKALFGELAAVQRYRNIRAGLPTRYYRDMVFEILTDELTHADKYNYILHLHANEMHRVKPAYMEEIDWDRKPKELYNPDELLMDIEPLVKRALAEEKAGINLTHLFQEFILSGVLVGKGEDPLEAIEIVEEWERTGKSKILQQSKKGLK